MPRKSPQENAAAQDYVEMTLRVRYAETDQMQRVHHAVYLVWFEAARAEFCRARGVNYTEMEEAGYFLPVVEASCRYRQPARYDEELTVRIATREVTRRTLRMGYAVRRGETLLAEGETYQVLIGADGKPKSFPPEIAALFAPNKVAEG